MTASQHIAEHAPRAFEARDVETGATLKSYPVRDGDEDRARAYARRFAKRQNQRAGERVAFVKAIY